MKMKRVISAAVAGLIMVSQSVFATEFKDMPDNWATSALQNAVDNGLLGGNGGYILPDDNMTRAEMATIMARACGAKDEADISAFTDVSPDEWYYSSMAKAVAMKAFNGSDNKLNPDDYITRQEAFVVLARVFSLNVDKNVDESVIDKFNDGTKIASWARKEVAAIINGGFVSGSNGYINPEDNITRAEFAVVMDRLIQHYIDDPTVSELPAEGNVMVRVGGVAVVGAKGDRLVIIGDGAGTDGVKFTDSELLNRFVIRGGKNVELSGTYGEVRVVMPNITANVAKADAARFYVCKDSVLDIGTLTPSDVSTSTPEKYAPVREEKTEETVEVKDKAEAEEGTAEQENKNEN